MAVSHLPARVRQWAARDPHYYALHRAIRVAVVMPVAFAIGSEIIGDVRVATLCAFGAFALLLFVDFPGNRASRASSYGMLAIVGAILVTLGTLLSKPSWLAVVSMAIVGFLVLFAGVVSSIVAVAGRATLLTFILPVMIPGAPGDVPARLLGWAIACAISIPVALLAWPPQDQNLLRVRTADACHALGHALELEPADPDYRSPGEALNKAVAEMRGAFRASASRPVALSTGSRMLMRLVDEIEWLTTTVAASCAEASAHWSEDARRLRTAASDALHACAAVLGHDGDGPTPYGCEELSTSMARLAEARATVRNETLAALRAVAVVPAPAGGSAPAAGEFDRPLYAAHELGYVVARTCTTVALIAAADSRPWFDRLLGRASQPGERSEVVAAERIAISHLDRHSVAWQNAIRGAAGLTAAVLIARLSGVQEGFWVVLGTLSVLRSNAVSTGATALRAVLGTIVGFALGGLLVAGIGTSPAVLWPLLPIVVFIAAYTPDLISFAAGQAAFTLAIIILFNIIAPAGWRIGVLRVTDVALGCVAAAAAGLLFWPRGAGAALGRAFADAYRLGSDHVTESIEFAIDRRDKQPAVHEAAKAAGLRMDAAFRQYLAERGAKNVPLESVTALTNGATRLRLAAEAITKLRADTPDGHARALRLTVDRLVDQTGRVTGWYRTLGGVVSGTDRNGDLPAIESVAESFLDVVLPAIDRCGDPGRAEMAERLLWSGQYLGDVNRMRGELVAPAAQVRATWRRAPWTR